MQRLEVSGAVRPIYGSLGVKRLTGESRKKFGVYYVPVSLCPGREATVAQSIETLRYKSKGRELNFRRCH